MLKSTVVAAALLAVWIAISAVSENIVHPGDDGTPIATLVISPDAAVRRFAPSRLARERADSIRALVEVASRNDGPEYDTPAKRSDSPKRAAITCLGILRADTSEAIRVLWSNLAYRQAVTVGTLNELTDPGSHFPAAAALAKIGKPACEGAWHELETTTDPVRRDLAAYVLQRVEGTEPVRMLVEQKLQQLAGQPELLNDATPQRRNLELARKWLIDRSKDGGSGGKPPTIGGRPLVDWSSRPSGIATTAPA